MSDEAMADKSEPRASDAAQRILGVLRIAKMTSQSGEGISLFDALRRTNYAAIRNEFEPSQIVPLLRASPDLVEQWLLFCENKRCGGWWVQETSRQVGWHVDAGRPFLFRKQILTFPSLEEAVADYVFKELDDTYSLMTNPGLRRWHGQVVPLIVMLIGVAGLAISLALARKWFFKY